MYTAKALVALLVITVSPRALSKASNVADDRGALRSVIADKRPSQEGGNRVERSTQIDGTVEKNIGDGIERFISVAADFAGDEHDGPPLTRLADGEDPNAVAPSRAEKGVQQVATKIQTNLRRTEGKRWKRRLRFDISVEDTLMEDEIFFRRRTQLPATPLLTAQPPTVKPTNFHRTSNPTSNPSYDTSEVLTTEVRE